MKAIIEDKERKLYFIQFSYSQYLVDAIKLIPGRRWDPLSKQWTVPTSNKKHIEDFARKYKFQLNRREMEPEITDFVIPDMPELDVPVRLKLDMYPYQKQGTAYNLQQKRVIVGDKPGLGKSNTLNSLISSPKGWLKMGDIKVGDSIFAKDGSVQMVTGVFPQGIVPTYRVTFNDGSFVDCNLEHLWSVRDNNRRARGLGWTTKTTAQILQSGLVNKSNPKREASGRKPSLKWEIPMCEPVQYTTKQFIIPAYTLGALIGDGSLTAGNVEMSLPEAKRPIIEQIEAELDSSLTVSVRRYSDIVRYGLVNAFDKYHHANAYMTELRRLKLDVVSGEKFIPTEYLQGDVEQRKALLSGLMDSDGSCNKNRTVFHTTSKLLVQNVLELIESLGGTAKIKSYNRTKEGKGLEYHVNVNTPFNPFRLKYKADNWHQNKMFKPTRYFESIEFIGYEHQQCIKVSSPDHLYLTNSYIVTHNTVQSIAAITAANAFPCLVICPSSLKINWQREWHMWTYNRAMVLEDKNKATWHLFSEANKTLFADSQTHVFITNYESLRKYFVKEVKRPKGESFRISDIVLDNRVGLFKSVIIDEAHRCKDSKTQQTKYARALAHGKQFILALTGTPIVNKPKDLISQLQLIQRLDDFGGYKGFIDRYCEGGDGAKNMAELNFRLRSTCFYQREKADVLKQLPAKMRQVVLCDITTKKEYNEALNDLETYLKKYRQASDEQVARSMRGEVMVRIGVLKNISARGKLNDVVEYISDIVDSGEKIVVFVHLKDVAAHLKKYFPNAVTILGDDPGPVRQANVDKFQKDPRVQVIICSIKAAGVGITLTASSRVAFVELPWHPADSEQCEDRCIVEGEPVLTPNGWTPIEQLTVGDKVINRFGENTTIVDAWNRGCTKLITEVNIEGWGVIKTTNDHKYLTTNGWVEAGRLMAGDKVVMPKPRVWDDNETTTVDFDNDCRIGEYFTGSGGQTIKNGRPIIAPEKVQLTDNALFVFGYFVGDGFASVMNTKGRFISVAGHVDKKRAAIEKCKEWFTSIGLNYSERKGSDNGCEIRAYSGEWAMFFDKHFGQKAKGKQLPEFLMHLNQRQSRIVLSGLMASDGYYRKARYEYVTASEKLASQVARLILRSGYRPTVNNNTTGQKLVAYAESQTNNKATVKSVLTRFPKKTNGKREQVYDITTDATESFVVGLSVVHNCHRIGQVDSVQCTYFLGKNTIDEWIYKIIEDKRGIANAATGSRDDVETNVMDSIINLFNQKIA